MILFKIVAILLSALAKNSTIDSQTVVMFWNVENFFDWRADSTSRSELEFSAEGLKKWTKKRFYTKCGAIAKTIMAAADVYGEIPDVVGLAEVENRFVLNQLVRTTPLAKFDYAVVHYDSPDRRGIDCALLYRRSRWRCIESRACHIFLAGGGEASDAVFCAGSRVAVADVRGFPAPAQIMKTRDILLAILEPVDEGGQGEPIAVLVNHHPSKVGGGSGDRREIAMQRLIQIRDSLLDAGVGRIIAVGDFNDAVDSAQGVCEKGPFYGRPGPLSPAGTIKFQGRWEKIDGCPVLEGLTAQEYIFDSPYLTEPDRSYSGTKPRRTYSGPRFLGGVSDHYPVIYLLTEY